MKKPFILSFIFIFPFLIFRVSFADQTASQIALAERPVDLGEIALATLVRDSRIAGEQNQPDGGVFEENEENAVIQAFDLAELEESAIRYQKSRNEQEEDQEQEDEQEEQVEQSEEAEDVDQTEQAEQNEQEAQVTNLNEQENDETDEQNQDQASSVEINGDIVEYSMDKQKVIASGNVIVVSKDMKLYCDRIEFSRSTNLAYATGNVRLKMKKGGASEMTGEKLTFNFATMKGKFDNAHIFADPYFGFGHEVARVDGNHMEMKDNYITTCDLDKPHYRLTSKKMDIYPGEKLVARGIRMFISKLPILYLPRMTQDLSDKKPMVTFTPGHDKDWGIFLLTQWRYHLNENFKGIIHLDAREKKDIAWGIDVNYKIPKYGLGKIRTYYMNERSITSDRFWQPRPSPTIERERFRVEWRHKWDIDKKTNAIAQYSRQSDSTVVKDYFENEFDEDFSPETFFLVTRAIPTGTLSFRTDARVNRFESAVERLPEVRYDMSNHSLWDTGLFLRNQTTFTNLTKKTASPSEVRQNTMRVDIDSALSYPMKISIFELNPFVGGRNTYYSKLKNPDDYGSIRGIFKTGASLSTRFYRVFNVNTDKYGFEIDRLRHIITPSVDYVFSNTPSLLPDEIDQFDGVDNLNIDHSLHFSLENKLQTKRNKESVDLLRAVIGTDFLLKEDTAKGGFDKINVDIDINPTNWINFFFDAQYDTRKEFLSTANFDLYINGGAKWSVNIGKRWNRNVDDQLTAGTKYVFNPKWALKTYLRFDLRSGLLKEQEFTLSRDLHAWIMDINFNETRKQGNEIWLVFTLKAFPDLAIDFGTSYNKRRAGSQSSEGDD